MAFMPSPYNLNIFLIFSLSFSFILFIVLLFLLTPHSSLLSRLSLSTSLLPLSPSLIPHIPHLTIYPKPSPSSNTLPYIIRPSSLPPPLKLAHPFVTIAPLPHLQLHHHHHHTKFLTTFIEPSNHSPHHNRHCNHLPSNYTISHFLISYQALKLLIDAKLNPTNLSFNLPPNDDLVLHQT